jgi:hypothetical protein
MIAVEQGRLESLAGVCCKDELATTMPARFDHEMPADRAR